MYIEVCMCMDTGQYGGWGGGVCSGGARGGGGGPFCFPNVPGPGGAAPPPPPPPPSLQNNLEIDSDL
jgi:hypothetical protein